MMGDNRDNSNDSRYWGVVDGKPGTSGKPLFIYWSYDAPPYDPRSKIILEHAQEYVSVAREFLHQDSLGTNRKGSSLTSS